MNNTTKGKKPTNNSKSDKTKAKIRQMLKGFKYRQAENLLYELLLEIKEMAII